MRLKIDTKEKFHVITVEEPIISATMTEELDKKLLSYLQNDGNQTNGHVKSVVIVLSQTELIEMEAAEKLAFIQSQFYEQGASFVICELTDTVEQFLDEHELLEILNVVPTESEAWDIVQMEEIERELLDGEN